MPYIQKNGKQFGLADISITNGVQCREMTQAQYDALSTAEKNDGTVYFIVDGKQNNLYISDTVPIGAIQAYGGSSAPAGWLMCNGMAVNRTVYKELFAVIGTTYGEGDTVTTFNLPNLNGRVAVGAGTGYALGAKGGETTHTLTVEEMPTHKHTFSNGYGWTGDFIPGASMTLSGTNNIIASPYHNYTGSTNNLKINTSGESQAHNNMQPYVVTNYIIKAKDTYQVGSSGGDSGGGGSVTVDSTAIPSPNMVAEFDDSAKMNSTDMSSQEITNFVNTIDAQGANLADYVIEQGVEGIWTWRKWSSGIAECWGTKQVTGSYSAWGNVFSYDIAAESYPINLFIATPICLAQGQCLTGNSTSSIESGGTKDVTPGILILRGTAQSGTYNFNAFYQVKGRWK